MSTVSGQQYSLTLYWAENGASDGNQLDILWDNAVVGNLYGTSPSGWAPYSYTVTGTGSDTLTIEGYNQDGWQYFTDVSLTAPSAVPLPGALLLFGPGLAGLAVVRRRFKK